MPDIAASTAAMEAESSPAKRRKLSPVRSVAVSAVQAESLTQSRKDGHTTPTFMSPTKSSLARFNPALLSPSKRLSRSEVVDVDRRRKSASPRRVQVNALETSARATTASPTRAAALRASLSEFSPLRLPSNDSALRAPVLQQDPTSTHQAQPEFGQPQAAQRLLPRPDRAAPMQKHAKVRADDDDEPDLPPTPEQLGLQPPSDPPRGLSSSSPLKSKSRRNDRVIGSSPLKPRPGVHDGGREVPIHQILDDEILLPAQLRQKKREAQRYLRDIRHKQRELDVILKQCQKLRSDVDSLREFTTDGVRPSQFEGQRAVDLM